MEALGLQGGLSISIDVAMIAAALVPVFTGLIAVWAQARKTDNKVNDVHTLVNDQMTAEISARLYLMESQRVVLKRVLGADAEERDKEILRELDRQIKRLKVQIKKRNRTADAVTSFGEENNVSRSLG